MPARELDLTDGWARSRQREFVRGRAAARRALSKIGATARFIGFTDDGAPIWPAGVTASIAHKKGLALAVAGRVCDFIALGVDVDFDDPRDAERAAIYATDQELNGAKRTGVATPASMVFVVKEAVYKCVAVPFSAPDLDFHEVEVTFTDPKTVAVTVPRLTIDLHGRVQRRGPWLAAVVWLKARTSGSA